MDDTRKVIISGLLLVLIGMMGQLVATSLARRTESEQPGFGGLVLLYRLGRLEIVSGAFVAAIALVAWLVDAL